MVGERALNAGVAEAVIPSQPGLDLAGFVARENPASGKRDEIYARALALETGGELLLLLSADVLGFEASTVRRIRESIARSLADAGRKQPPGGIMVCCSHTHSAPASMPLRECGEMSPMFVEQAVRTLSEAATAAVRQLRPARLGTGSGTLRGVSGNRRSPGWPPGQNAPDSGEVSVEPMDPEVGVLRVDTEEGKPLACLVNFACHPVILGHDSTDISADYPGVVTARLRERLGGTVVTLFANGATGDINPVRRGSWSDVEWLAGAVADEAERVWHGIATHATVGGAFSSRSEEITLPLLPLPPRAELEAAADRFRLERETATRGTDKRIANAFLRWAEDALAAKGREPLSLPVEIQVLRIGDAALVAVPGEFFVELGLEIKKRLAAVGIRPAWILGFANGNIGYIPTRAAYKRGGYEVESAHRYYGQPACVAPEAGEWIVARAVALATQ
jgi:hypothetical protein